MNKKILVLGISMLLLGFFIRNIVISSNIMIINPIITGGIVSGLIFIGFISTIGGLLGKK